MQKLQIPIEDLPEGLFKERLIQLVDRTETVVWVVAKEGYASDWTAYIGFPHLHQLKSQFRSSSNYEYYCTRVHFPADVADRGDKLSRQEAEALFPQLAKSLRYR